MMGTHTFKKKNNVDFIVLFSFFCLFMGLLANCERKLDVSDKQVSRTLKTDSIRLDSVLKDATNQIDVLSGANEDMRGIVNQMKLNLIKLGSQVGVKISRGIEKDQLNDQFGLIEETVERYKSQIAEYKSEIILFKNNKMLIETTLANEKNEFERQMLRLTKQRDSINKLKELVVQKNIKLDAVKHALSIEIDEASKRSQKAMFLPVTISSITPQYRKKNTTKANRVESYHIRFKAGINPLVDPGEQIFYLRIINANGVPVKVGNEEIMIDGIPIRYLKSISTSYEGSSKECEFNWDTGDDKLASGNYKLEIYNNTTLVGEALFTLK